MSTCVDKSHIVFPLNCCCCLLSHSLLVMALLKQSALWIFQHLSLSLCISISFSDTPLKSQTFMGPKGTKGLLNHRLPSPGLQTERCHCQRLKIHTINAEPSHGLQWPWRRCSCLHCHRGQEDDRFKVTYQISASVENWQGITRNWQLPRCVTVHIHSYWDRRQKIFQRMWTSFAEWTLPDTKPPSPCFVSVDFNLYNVLFLSCCFVIKPKKVAVNLVSLFPYCLVKIYMWERSKIWNKTVACAPFGWSKTVKSAPCICAIFLTQVCVWCCLCRRVSVFIF